jgi:acyl-CoA reductase-like NAD-dependent aldehyde dehydrogenase
MHLPLPRPPSLPQCFHAAGVPPGVINCVTGRGSDIGDYLTTHPGANCISFTGGDTGIDICKKAGMVPIQVRERSAAGVAVGGRVGGWWGG